jgi:hypothetical protein
MPSAGMISCDITDAGGLSVSSFNGMTNVTIVAQLANGKTIVGNNMWTVDTQEAETVDGKFAVKWEGPSVKEA